MTMNKRLVKNADRKLFGVCGALSAYFGIDSTLIRIGFLLAVFGFGTGILLYLIMAMVIPEN
jgi:phage shock protein PspC (stress-responsive transcriptional regulator)